MKKTGKVILMAAGAVAAAAALAGTASYVITEKLMKIAMERDGVGRIEDIPVARKQLRGFEEGDAFLEALNRGEKALRSIPMETVELKSYDGTLLIGHWYPCPEPQRVILAMHGWRSSWARDFGTVAEFWHSSRCSVLFAEQRGQGESGGEYMGFGLTERHDCVEWCSWLAREKAQGLPVYPTGVSMGAATVMMASELELPKQVRGIIADCGYTSPYAIWKHVAENNLHLSFGLRGKIVEDMCRKKVQVSPREVSAADALRNTNIPVLFVHGGKDHFVPVDMTYENYAACAAPKRIFIVPEADHGMSYFKDRKGYEKAFLDFWREFDG